MLCATWFHIPGHPDVFVARPLPADDVALDELSLLARGLAERSRGEAIETAHRANGRLVE